MSDLFQQHGLTLRDVQPGDAPALVEILNYYVLNSVATLDTEPLEAAFFDAKFKAVEAFGGPFLVLASQESDKALAYAYGAAYRPKKGYNSTTELTIYLDPSITGKGIGPALLHALVERCRAAGFKLAISVITVDPAVGAASMPSGKLHLRAGFQLKGELESVATKNGQFWDTAEFTLDLAPHRTTP